LIISFLLSTEDVSAWFSVWIQVDPLTLHGIQPTRFFLSHQVHLADIALSDQFDLVEAAGTNLDVADLDRVGAVRSAECDRLANLAWGGNSFDSVFG
jgi:hypothetical protein